MRRTHAGVQVADKVETQAARNGRGHLASILEGIAELRDRGMVPTKVKVSRAMVDDLRAYFDYVAASFDGVLPRQVRGVPIEYVPGAEKRVDIVHVPRATLQ